MTRNNLYLLNVKIGDKESVYWAVGEDTVDAITKIKYLIFEASGKWPEVTVAD